MRQESNTAAAIEPRDCGEFDFASTRFLAARLVGGDLEALDTLLELNQDRLMRILSIRIATNLQEMLEASVLFSGAEELARQRLAKLDASQPAAVLDWLAKLSESLLRKRIGIVTSRSVSSPNDASRPPARKRDRRRAVEDLLDRTVQGLGTSAREILLARDYLKGDWNFVRKSLGYRTVQEAKAAYQSAQALLRKHMHRKLARRKRPPP
ncbi:MAG: hypothetical protein CMJ89_03995 [Planctomycetes bacterium]|jgi:hypothetical protein|nr:hypothetical protein [Planctomycetota bacterium]